jgi:putative membrane protein
MTMLHNLLGFALSLLLVFRTNTAYERWWEGRRLWGNLINCSRNMAMKLNSFLSSEDKTSRQLFIRLIPLYAHELKYHLQLERTRLEMDERPHPEIPDFDTSKHIPNQVASLIISHVNQLYRDQKISGDQLILLNPEMSSLIEICGACERIRNTPIPYSYSSYIKKFIFVYVMTLPIGYAFSLGYLVVPVAVFIFYVLASLELIAEEIEEPFGKDANDLPLQRMTESIQKYVADILG